MGLLLAVSTQTKVLTVKKETDSTISVKKKDIFFPDYTMS